MKALSLALLLSVPGAGGAAAATYTETFPYSGPTQEQSLRNEGWCGGNAGDLFCDNISGGEGAISQGIGVGGTQGFAFWSQTAIGADSFLYTTEFTFRTSQGPRLSWGQRDSARSGVTDPARIALLVGTDWYISDTTYSHVSATDWMLMSADLGALTWFVRGTGGTPSVLPGGGLGTGGIVLPADQIVGAFGFWWDGPKVATSRFDDVSISVVPTPTALPLLLAGLGALALAARRRKAA